MKIVTAGNRLTAPQGMDQPMTMSAVLRKQSNEFKMLMDKSIYYHIYYILETVCQTFGDYLQKSWCI